MNDMTSTSARVLAVTLGVLLSADFAIAREPATDEASVETIAETQRDLARAANERAAEEAAKAVRAANRLDLDIRLIGPTSVKIASGRQVAR
jgi:hypothetical protein